MQGLPLHRGCWPRSLCGAGEVYNASISTSITAQASQHKHQSARTIAVLLLHRHCPLCACWVLPSLPDQLWVRLNSLSDQLKVRRHTTSSQNTAPPSLCRGSCFGGVDRVLISTQAGARHHSTADAMANPCQHCWRWASECTVFWTAAIYGSCGGSQTAVLHDNAACLSFRQCYIVEGMSQLNVRVRIGWSGC